MVLGKWLQDRPQILEYAFRLANRGIHFASPIIKKIGYSRVDRWLRGSEEFGKRIVFDCRMCGQCILHSSGMTCPMTCPKNLRNGPCGGVRQNGCCEVIPEMKCVWLEAVGRSTKMKHFGHEIKLLQAPLNHQLKGTSAWVNMLNGEELAHPNGWIGLVEYGE